MELMKMFGIGKNVRNEIINKLYEIDTVKFGKFTLKTGTSSPVYIDFRGIISEPTLMVEVSDLLYQTASKLSFLSICGVPYTALPFATLISAKHSVPMLIRRKEVKSYGTKKLVEGRIKSNDVCLIVEDVATTGSSILETVEVLKSEGVVVRDAVVLLDREQGAHENLMKNGITLHSIFTMTEVLDMLLKMEKIDQNTVDMVKAFLAETSKTVTDMPVSQTRELAVAAEAGVTSGSVAVDSTQQPLPVSASRVSDVQPTVTRTSLGMDPESDQTFSYADRIGKVSHPLSKQLFTIMNEKKSNLAFAADVKQSSKLLELAERVGPYICVLKTHADLLKDFSQETMARLVEIAHRHKFLIFEDRKFADIGETVREQFSGGTLAIKDWSDFVTVHSLPGPGVIQGLRQEAPGKGCVIVAEMSSEGCLTATEYINGSVKLAEQYRDFVIGFVCQSRVVKDPEFVYFTPGVNLATGGDTLGQRYRTPHMAVVSDRCDVIIVGRGIRDAADPAAVAEQYRDAGFKAHEELLGNL